MRNGFSIQNLTKSKLPRLLFSSLKNDILGSGYSLSVTFVDEIKSREINKKYRNINKPTNVLSFSLRKNMGEIILCPTVIRREAKSFEKTFRRFLGFLVIHGMLHLKGFQHSSRIEEAEMETEEKKYEQKYFSGNRRGVVHDTMRGRRILEGRKKS